MEVFDIILERPAIILPTIVMMMLFLMMEVLECLRVMEDIDLCLNILVSLPFTFMSFIYMVIEVVMVEEVDIFLQRPATNPLKIMELVFMLW